MLSLCQDADSFIFQTSKKIFENMMHCNPSHFWSYWDNLNFTDRQILNVLFSKNLAKLRVGPPLQRAELKLTKIRGPVLTASHENKTSISITNTPNHMISNSSNHTSPNNKSNLRPTIMRGPSFQTSEEKRSNRSRSVSPILIKNNEINVLFFCYLI